MKSLKKALSLTLAFVLSLSLAAPALAAEPSPEISFRWVSGIPMGMADAYIRELDWLIVSFIGDDGDWVTVVADLETGTEIDAYDSLFYFSDGLMPVGKHGKYGYIDTTGTVAIPLEYDYAGEFSEGLAAVSKNGKHGYIDKTGTVVVPLEYDYAGEFSQGLAAVGNGDWQTGQYGYIDKTGTVVVPLEYDYAGEFSQGLAAVSKNGRVGYISKTGSVAIPLEYDYAEEFSDGLARVGKDWKYGFIDKTGSVVVPLEYRNLHDFLEGMAMIENYGYIDRNGRILPLPEYDYTTGFSDGLAAVGMENGGWGYIDKTGALVVPLEYDWAEAFSEGMAQVHKDGKIGFIDTTGTLVVPLEYDNARRFCNGLAVVGKRGYDGSYKYGFVDKTGALAVPLEYDFTDSVSLGDINNDIDPTPESTDPLCWVLKDGRYGFFDSPYFKTGTGSGSQPVIPAALAYPSTQTVDLDGKKVEFQMYALKDANGNPTNYVKVRDLALALSGTAAQFSVEWDGAVNLVAGSDYAATGSENSTPFSGERAYTVPTSPTKVNGTDSDLQAIVLTDDAGGGYTYYQLRDLGRRLGFNVDWSLEKGVFIETGKPYSEK